MRIQPLHLIPGSSHHPRGSKMINSTHWTSPELLAISSSRGKMVQQTHPSPSHWLNPHSDQTRSSTIHITFDDFPISNVYNWPTFYITGPFFSNFSMIFPMFSARTSRVSPPDRYDSPRNSWRRPTDLRNWSSTNGGWNHPM